MAIQNSHPFHEVGYQERPQFRGGRRGGLGGRGYRRPQEEFPRHEAWHDDNFYDDYGDNPNIGQKKSSGRCLASRVIVILICSLIGKDK
ncbi:hypothetical protein M9H77_02917 [Catharanthus roseus]|uniref:Uncharacterized protein n=1 Tax=Catharanthus roseus TaxID=4058 RepID=A0ACC0CA70_CATRO|nr:hypothetical protein M9H77_02917 [Catharanthus roseus]